MAQFDVYKNPNRDTRTTFPYIVDIQNSVISGIATRIVIPLGKMQLFENTIMKGLTPEIEYGGEKLVLLVPQITSVPAKYLKKPLGTLRHCRDEIVAALDFAITGI